MKEYMNIYYICFQLLLLRTNKWWKYQCFVYLNSVILKKIYLQNNDAKPISWVSLSPMFNHWSPSIGDVGYHMAATRRQRRRDLDGSCSRRSSDLELWPWPWCHCLSRSVRFRWVVNPTPDGFNYREHLVVDKEVENSHERITQWVVW